MSDAVLIKDGAATAVFLGTADATTAANSAAAAAGSATAAASSAAGATAALSSAGYVVAHVKNDAPAGWLRVDSDDNGRVAGGITDQGILTYNRMQAYFSYAVGTSGEQMLPSSGGVLGGIRDASGNYPWYVGEDGTMNAGAAVVSTLNGLATNQLVTQTNIAAPKPALPAQLLAIPFDGQSLAIGVNTGSAGVGLAITTTTRFGSAGALMLHGGVRSWDPTEDDASLVAAVEVVGAGGQAAGSVGESPASGFAEFLNELLWKENGLAPADHGMQSVIFAPGLGSTTIAQHQSGQSLYTRHHTEAAAIKSLATGLGKTCKKLATNWLQGESDASNSSYATNLITLRNSDAAATKTEFGQTEELYYICYQNQVPMNALQTYEATKQSQYIKIANPTGWMVHTDGVHFSAYSSKLQGAYHALMYKRLFIDGRKWNAIRPARDVDGNLAVTVSGAVATMTFDVPSGGQIIHDGLSAKGVQRQFGHYLFQSDGTTEIAVSAVEIVGRNQVKITAAATIPTGAIWRYGSLSATSATHTANLGNMRDNQGDWLRFDGLANSMNTPMHNWCVVFQETIS